MVVSKRKNPRCELRVDMFKYLRSLLKEGVNFRNRDSIGYWISPNLIRKSKENTKKYENTIRKEKQVVN